MGNHENYDCDWPGCEKSAGSYKYCADHRTEDKVDKINRIYRIEATIKELEMERFKLQTRGEVLKRAEILLGGEVHDLKKELGLPTK